MIYKTKQKEYLYNLLLSNKNSVFTISKLRELAKNSGFNIATATVYRFLNKLTNENQLRKILNANKEAEYQLIQKKHDRNFCAKCNKCGKLINIKCATINKLSKHLIEEHKFKLDLLTTTILGTCKNCNNTGKTT